jgi:hypothetical protein
MNLESRPVAFEDIGRQILAHGHYKSPTDYLNMIGKDLKSIMRIQRAEMR